MTPVAYCCTERVKNHAHTRPRMQDVCIKSLLISSRPVSFLPAAPKLSRTCVLAVIDMLNFLLPEARTRATFLKLPAAEELCCGSCSTSICAQHHSVCAQTGEYWARAEGARVYVSCGECI